MLIKNSAENKDKARFKFLLIIIFVLTSFCALKIKICAADTVLYQENFSSVSADNWTEQVSPGANWSINNGKYHFHRTQGKSGA